MSEAHYRRQSATHLVQELPFFHSTTMGIGKFLSFKNILSEKKSSRHYRRSMFPAHLIDTAGKEKA
ncbi:hypothetical protein [Pseudoalteromonas rubra]|uniref:hypothetical protein n=1 Tax=Pseudoalteromonas rubra TaxID=43658 RepID=UPI001109AA67|nr:hypothetical protein [Pseudoalteromonas rubra]